MTSKNSSQSQSAPLAGLAAYCLLNSKDKELKKFAQETLLGKQEETVESVDSKPKKK